MTTNQEFESHFQNEYGARWPNVFASLTRPPLQCLRRSLFSIDDPGQETPGPALSHLSECYIPRGDKAQYLALRNDVFRYYFMDPASVIVAQSLPIKLGDRVLDMCAAPGGKSLILAEKLFLEGEGGELFCNELANPRRERLKYILQNYIPREKRQSVFIKGIDGQLFGRREPESFDAILLDAPCTGERHLLEDAGEYKKWTVKRTRNNSIRQFSLLSSAWHALKPGGYIMYSTCSISNAENDDVVQKLKDRREVEIVRLEHLQSCHFVEKSQFGYQILPDRPWNSEKQDHFGAGPMYFSLIRKL